MIIIWHDICEEERKEERDYNVYSTWNLANTSSFCSRILNIISFAEPVLICNQRMLSQMEGFRVTIRSYQFLSSTIKRLPNVDIGPFITTLPLPLRKPSPLPHHLRMNKVPNSCKQTNSERCHARISKFNVHHLKREVSEPVRLYQLLSPNNQEGPQSH